MFSAFTNKLTIYNITDPQYPIKINSINTNVYGFSKTYLDVCSSMVYMSFDSDLEIIDISNLNELKLAGFERTEHLYRSGIASYGKYFFESVSSNGVRIFQNDLITGIKDVNSDNTNLYKDYANASIYPNPFNYYTNLNLDITNNSHIKIFLYNSIGERIKIIVDEELTRGNHRITINGSGLSSGIYYLMITTDLQKEVMKFIYLK